MCWQGRTYLARSAIATHTSERMAELDLHTLDCISAAGDGAGILLLVTQWGRACWRSGSYVRAQRGKGTERFPRGVAAESPFWVSCRVGVLAGSRLRLSAKRTRY